MENTLNIGDELTVAREIIDYSSIVFSAGQKVIVREIEYTGGYYSRFFEMYEPKKISLIKVVGVYGCWKPSVFVEFESGAIPLFNNR